ncbi:hypothetical protein FSARC_1491 [Fusarium sarcochroum]|uniref:Uncharacterized protein n=1 Tax=Fusarium sarcochroum TaxID=1208366 RepID=A0A8H4U9B4_9HYPO|nr:hypothetical protein FSARC_1491 [Fusarium sarcochroum]
MDQTKPRPQADCTVGGWSHSYGTSLWKATVRQKAPSYCVDEQDQPWEGSHIHNENELPDLKAVLPMDAVSVNMMIMPVSGVGMTNTGLGSVSPGFAQGRDEKDCSTAVMQSLNC